MKTKIYAFDNEGRTYDRYTIITSGGDIYGCSANPSHPTGFGQFIYNLIDEGRTIEDYLDNLRSNPDWLGRELQFETLPEKVREFINQKLNNNVDI